MAEYKKLHQIILLDREGLVHYSCDSLFEASKYKKESLLEMSPFLESIMPNLRNLNPKSAAVRFSKLENPCEELPGAYDFSFQWVNIHEGNFILWCIYDYSQLYESIRISQQKRQELELYKESLESTNKKFHSIKEFQSQ